MYSTNLRSSWKKILSNIQPTLPFHYLEIMPSSYFTSLYIFMSITARSLGGAEIGWNLNLGLCYFEKNELQRHFIEWISISSAFIEFINYLRSHLRIYVFSNIRFVGFEFRGFSPPGRHRVSHSHPCERKYKAALGSPTLFS